MSYPVIFLFAVFASEMQFTEAIIFNFSNVLMMASTLKNLNKNEDWQTVGFKPRSTQRSTVLSIPLFTVQKVTPDRTLAHSSVTSAKCNSTAHSFDHAEDIFIDDS